MRLLVSGATKTVERMIPEHSENLGILITPHTGNRIEWVHNTALPWAVDNGCFGGFDEHRFTTMVILKLWRKRRAWGCSPLWVTAPDVVAKHDETMKLFAQWEPMLHGWDMPVAFVAQDGATTRSIPWDSLEAIFIGGSTAWKTGLESEEIVKEGKRRGRQVHMGRVNSQPRLKIAVNWEVDTVDGSGFSMFPDTRIPMFFKWLKTS